MNRTHKRHTLQTDLLLGSEDQFERTANLREYVERASNSDQMKSQHLITGAYPKESILSCELNGPILYNELYHPHPLVMCCSRAYSDHYNLILSPDDIWLLIAQGLSVHVQVNSEEVRSLFISDDTLVTNENNKDNTGKINISISMEKYVRRVEDNCNLQDMDWEGVIEEITGEIDSNLKKDTIQLLECDFSTTSPVEKVSSRVAIMSSFKNYFHYWNVFKCGLPSITLMGTLEDWTRLKEKTLQLNKYGLEFWTNSLAPILDNFIETYSCESQLPQPLINFWNGIARHFNMSGGKKVDGWINYFFPYANGSVKSYLKSFDLERFHEGKYHVDSCNTFTSGISRVRVDTINSPLKNVSSLDYLSGFLGYDYDEHLQGLKPRIGWLISKSSDSKL